MSHPVLRSAAILTLRKPGKMTKRGRKSIANWLRKQAQMLERYGYDYTDTGDFRARYLHR